MDVQLKQSQHRAEVSGRLQVSDDGLKLRRFPQVGDGELHDDDRQLDHGRHTAVRQAETSTLQGKSFTWNTAISEICTRKHMTGMLGMEATVQDT